MKNLAPIAFTDVDSNDEANILIRYDDTTVELGITLKSDGDIAVFMPKDIARKVVAALQQTIDSR